MSSESNYIIIPVIVIIGSLFGISIMYLEHKKEKLTEYLKELEK